MARAIATQILGFRSNIFANQVSLGVPCRTAARATAIAPIINSFQISRWPVFDVRPNRDLPPVECWRGIKPTHAAKSRPHLKPVIAGAKSYARKLVTAWSGGILQLLDSVLDFNPLDGLGHTFGSVALSPLGLG